MGYWKVSRMDEVKSRLVVTDDYGNTFTFVKERMCEMHRYRNALGLIDEWQCSECGADVNGIADDTPPNYCPSCGAKVVEQ